MRPLQLSHFTATSCLGRGTAAQLAALREERSGLARCSFETVELDTCVGEVAGVDHVRLPHALADFDCRNNRLAALGLAQDDFIEHATALRGRVGAERIGTFIGTSTSGILQAELAYRRCDPVGGELPADFVYAKTQNSFSVADFVRRRLELRGPAATVSSACSSSAKVFGSAARMIEAGVIDAAVVGGVDSLCLTTLYGFSSLQLTSSAPCRPFDRDRDGLSIGEAAAFFLIERLPATPSPDAIALLGVGESSDAYHMSSPHPDGLGARMAMEQALAGAALAPEAIDYVNLHGTGTRSNDSVEGRAVLTLFGNATPCSSTKGAFGHTLGAAGGVEAMVCALALRHGFLPGGVNTRHLDPALPLAYLLHSETRAPLRALSNSFGFGGTNCSLVLGRADALPHAP
ncbi:MAG: beta-ketoacyl-[acyl-carrier-protein] synthase family protein [Casimicrobiaceae bacterium]